MKAVLFIIACLVAAIMAAPLSENQYQFLFTKFVEQYTKKYEVSDFFTRFETFKSNLDLIVAHNAQGLSWTMGVNQFSDMTAAEFNKFLGLRTELHQPFAMSQLQATVKVRSGVTDIDWRTKNVVQKVKDQASCGSCWAFSTISPLETAYAIANTKLYDLAEQQLVDCSGSTGNEGCNGGLMSNAIEYLVGAGGACETSAYPYTASDGSCKSCQPVVKPSGYKSIATTDDAHIDALQSGSISVAIAASSSAFQFYKSGVLTSCSDRSINHGVTLVGYQTDVKTFSGYGYYLLRNSWGTSWGDAGYMKIAAGNKLCGLTTSSFDVFPTL